MLADEYHIPGKASKVGWMLIFPSYLGQLIETGSRLGYKPSDFGLRRIDISGEIATEGAKKRSQQLFGDVALLDGYGMTETWSMGAEMCPEGHLHFGTTGVVEFINPDTGDQAKPGEVARVVATPLMPYRDTTIVLRYDTQDMVRMLGETPTCGARHLPATSPLLGRRRLSVRHDDGSWTFPRDVLEALEALEEWPLPARFGFWKVAGGVAVEVVAPSDSTRVRHEVEESLEARGIPLKELYLRENRSQLQQPYLLRGDLKELAFSAPVEQDQEELRQP
jgi:acyl-CoA synthetase (AMP-forming)/AMP-acid ligase II